MDRAELAHDPGDRGGDGIFFRDVGHEGRGGGAELLCGLCSQLFVQIQDSDFATVLYYHLRSRPTQTGCASRDHRYLVF